MSGTSTPSSRAVISRTAWSPRNRTSSQIGRTTARTESMSVAARGSSCPSSRGPGRADPRRSMRDSTEHLRGRTGEHPTVDARVTRPCCPYAPAVGQSDEAASRSTREVIPLFPLETPLFPGLVLPLRIFEPRYRRLVADLTSLPEGAERRFGVVAIRQGWEVERIAPAEALYDVGCTAVLRMVAPQADGGYRVAAVGADRFRLLEVLVPGQGTTEPPYLRARVEWLSEEEAAEEAAGDAGEVVGPEAAAGRVDDELVTEVARGSLEVLAGNVRDLFARYVADVAVRQGGLTGGLPDEVLDVLSPDDLPDEDDDAAEEIAATAALLREVGDDPLGLSYLVASAALLTTEDRQALLAESATRRRLAMESRLLRRELTLRRALGAVPVPLREFATPITAN